MNEKPYIVYYEELSELVGFDGAAICAKVLSMADEQGVARISLQYLCKIGNLSKGALKRLLLRLQVFGYIEYKTFEGKGRLTEFRKGSNLIPFEYDQKGLKCTAKRVQNEPLQIDNINRLNPREAARVNKQTKRASHAGDTPAPPSAADMEQFEQFWQAFFFGTYAQYERTQEPYKERAAAVWYAMSESARATCLQQVRTGKRYDRTYYVLKYLQDYREPLSIWYDGDYFLTPENLRFLVRIYYKDKIGYCYPKDLERCVKSGAIEFPHNKTFADIGVKK